MFLDELQKRFADMQGKANWQAVFGDVIEVDGRRLIPVASVQYLFGMGGGQVPTRSGARSRGVRKLTVPPPGGRGSPKTVDAPCHKLDDGRQPAPGPMVLVTSLVVCSRT